MPIKIGTTEIDNVKLGSTQIDKVYLGTDLVWQNYVEWTASGSTSKEYSYDRTISYSIPSGNKVTTVTGYGNRDNVGEEVGYVTIEIYVYYNGSSHLVQTSGPSLNYSSTTWTNTNEYEITSILIHNRGTTLPASVGYRIVGLQKGS